MGKSLIGHSLWEFIKNEETVHIYRTLIHRIRNENRNVIYPFRCDSPSRRRFMEMHILPHKGKSLEFRSRIIREEHRPFQRFLDIDEPRNDSFIVMCGWCKAVATKDGWAQIEEAVDILKLFEMQILPEISHGICKECHDKWLQELEPQEAKDSNKA
ncbi:MAG: hypothetical protein GF315_07585 [candidate division Zixibacteria bacterium]|nr:hypothetical protein [candidate division Zixibacteria bacterium]